VKVLIVGGGAREHALAWKIQKDAPDAELIAAPGNPGIAAIARCFPLAATDVAGLADLAAAEGVDLTVVGPEAALEAGIADRFLADRRAIFGPTRTAAQIETSKRFAKTVMEWGDVPTARATVHTDLESAVAAVDALASESGKPIVVKASGLAAGKGVIIAQSAAEAKTAIRDMLVNQSFGAAGAEVLVEEFMTGEELSLFFVTDGENALPLPGAQDHKRLLEGDQGPNTGGMGAYAPVSIATHRLVEGVRNIIVEPTLGVLQEMGCPFRGLLYAGLMITDEGPKVVEFNCRFGDPETEAVLPLLDSSLLDAIKAVAEGGSLSGAPPFAVKQAAAVTTVVAADGYPEKPRSGDRITLPIPREGVEIFHAGTKLTSDGSLVTSGGRVVAVTAVAPTMAEAATLSRSEAEKVEFGGRQLRRDIGWRELERSARAT
jgi:phosphoribosylamine---glycine ligase